MKLSKAIFIFLLLAVLILPSAIACGKGDGAGESTLPADSTVDLSKYTVVRVDSANSTLTKMTSRLKKVIL